MKMMSSLFSNNRSFADLIIAIVIMLIIWWVISIAANPILFPPPLLVLHTALEMAKSGSLWADVFITTVRVLVGYVLGVVGGVFIGILIGRVECLGRYIEPLIGFIRTIPPVAIIPLAVIWFGIGETSKYFVVFYGTIFVVVYNVIDGARNVPITRLLAARSLGASPLQEFVDIVLPSLVPAIWTGMKTAVGFAFMAVVAAELIAARSGIGNLIMQSRTLLETDRMFVGLAALATMGGAADWAFGKIGKRLLFRYLDYLKH
ncbi:NitT/TauT family transport system permease protein OS=Castellaniella defragrans OX=75697 GN=HNR28_000322 PE=3 SV=1 [Castellaniella defragrans]